MAAANRLAPIPGENPDPKPQAVRRQKLVRRRGRNRSQQLRLGIQVLFLMLNAWLGLQLFLFVRAFETGAGTPLVSRPAGVEGWLPIAGLMNLKYSLVTGTILRVHPAAMILLVAFLLMSFFFRKAFCSWFCPIGTLSEALWKFGRRLLRRNWEFPGWLDIPLRGLKYLLLGFFLYAIAGLSAEAIRGFLVFQGCLRACWIFASRTIVLKGSPCNISSCCCQ